MTASIPAEFTVIATFVDGPPFTHGVRCVSGDRALLSKLLLKCDRWMRPTVTIWTHSAEDSESLSMYDSDSKSTLQDLSAHAVDPRRANASVMFHVHGKDQLETLCRLLKDQGFAESARSPL
jgi:hypothetical protein